jgi:hypothetical protein
MKKHQVTIDTPKNFKVMEFDDFNTAVKMAVKYKEYAFARKLHWTISFFTDKHLVARITT